MDLKTKIYNSLAAFGIVALTYCAVAYTPIRTTIPGYPNAYSRQLALSNALKIDSLENILTRWELYADNLSRVLTGEESLDFDTVVKGNTTKYLSAKSREYLAGRDSLLRDAVRKEEQFALDEKPRKSLPLEGRHFFTPYKGVVSQPFDQYENPGVVINSATSAVVSSVLDGTVILSSWDEAEGWTMVIQHSDGILSVYRNAEKLLKSSGDDVRAGTPVALAGVSQGNVRALHFQLWYKCKAVDPALYMTF